jgi:hypothetical protein
MSYTFTQTELGAGNIQLDVLWSVNAQRYILQSNLQFTQLTRTIFDVADSLSALIPPTTPDYRLLRPFPATEDTTLGLNGNTTAGLNANTGGGLGNTTFGSNAKKDPTNYCVAVGFEALKSNSGNNNTAIGYQASYAGSPSGNSNTSVGYYSHARGGGDFNVGIGSNSLVNNTANYNVAVGDNSLRTNDFGVDNVAIGAFSLNQNVTGSSNSAVGRSSLRDNTGSENSAFGKEALTQNTSGSNNTAVGFQALASNRTASVNTAVGAYALNANNGTNGANTGVGTYCLFASTGAHNTGFGYQAGQSIVAGNGNTIAGSGADVDSGSRSLCLVLGRGAVSPAVNGSLAIGGTGANTMTNLVVGLGGFVAGANYLSIYLSGTQYKIALLQAP